MFNMQVNVFESVDNYIADLFVGEDNALRDIERSILEARWPNQSISANQGKFLQTMALVCRAKKILEIGSFAGYSTAWLAGALADDGKLISLEFDPVHWGKAKSNIQHAGLQNKVDIRLGKALELLPQIEADGEGPFDMIFIDADKPPYAEYLDWAIRLGRPGTLIIADNVVRDGKVLDPTSNDEKVKGVQRFNKHLAENKSVTATILQMVGIKEHDGMAIAVIK